MKQRMFASKEIFENKYPYVVVNFSDFEPASIIKDFSSKKQADNFISKNGCGEAMTRKRANPKITEFNKKYN